MLVSEAPVRAWEIDFLLPVVRSLVAEGSVVLELGLPRLVQPNYPTISIETFGALANFTGSVDVAFCSFTLCRIPAEQIEHIARELSRVVRHILITSEDEGRNDAGYFPRNYRKLFARHGWREIARHYAMDLTDDSSISMMSYIRIFKR